MQVYPSPQKFALHWQMRLAVAVGWPLWTSQPSGHVEMALVAPSKSQIGVYEAVHVRLAEYVPATYSQVATFASTSAHEPAERSNVSSPDVNMHLMLSSDVTEPSASVVEVQLSPVSTVSNASHWTASLETPSEHEPAISFAMPVHAATIGWSALSSQSVHGEHTNPVPQNPALHSHAAFDNPGTAEVVSVASS